METAPKIDKEYQKVEVVVTKGTNVTLKVPYTGTPIPNATWYHKGQPLEKDGSPKVRPVTDDMSCSKKDIMLNLDIHVLIALVIR